MSRHEPDGLSISGVSGLEANVGFLNTRIRHLEKQLSQLSSENEGYRITLEEKQRRWTQDEAQLLQRCKDLTSEINSLRQRAPTSDIDAASSMLDEIDNLSGRDSDQSLHDELAQYKKCFQRMSPAINRLKGTIHKLVQKLHHQNEVIKILDSNLRLRDAEQSNPYPYQSADLSSANLNSHLTLSSCLTSGDPNFPPYDTNDRMEDYGAQAQPLRSMISNSNATGLDKFSYRDPGDGKPATNAPQRLRLQPFRPGNQYANISELQRLADQCMDTSRRPYEQQLDVTELVEEPFVMVNKSDTTHLRYGELPHKSMVQSSDGYNNTAAYNFAAYRNDYPAGIDQNCADTQTPTNGRDCPTCERCFGDLTDEQFGDHLIKCVEEYQSGKHDDTAYENYNHGEQAMEFDSEAAAGGDKCPVCNYKFPPLSTEAERQAHANDCLDKLS